MAHVLITILGLWLLVLILRSMIRIALINRHYRDWFAEAASRVVYSIVSFKLHNNHDPKTRHLILLWFFPAYLLSLIFVYFVGAMTSFVLLYWGLSAVGTWHQAFLASGSALNTLGFATPTTITGQWLAIPEGALGLGIVVFLFTFIPGYQTVIRAREDKTSWLYVRTRDQPTGVALLEWCQRAGIAGGMKDIWGAWEDWFRMLGDTHSVMPMLAMSPSVQQNQSWVLAGAAVLDAASLAACVIDSADRESARICVQTGTRAFLAIADALGRTCPAARLGTYPSREKFELALGRLKLAGLILRSADADLQWRELMSLRERYEESMLFIAKQTFAPLEGSLEDLQHASSSTVSIITYPVDARR
ncbi:hypothetical protein [Granulicella mallensis]|uniref:Ion transport 2 domain protein n=1 Tax=Granulicella mallensis TaxID=940614 RepID=A0A7W7ZM68_9BACT|nr:hypothetical protein [Granulicella mallensis]MBB5062497.1 hypothetical protein [Granulicella mallensis]